MDAICENVHLFFKTNNDKKTTSAQRKVRENYEYIIYLTA